ncbi:ROK family protein (plasmid) [Streptomyces sp. NBC_00335]|uniref:ROK family protein n=1 Tax=unclassified Streptomyces TaxID=2593676 RepID=UPI0022572206|nr:MULTISPECIES: ROK family protein [unclassified Streptomyces]MCX5410018.1 ROK family protein [Streptomyces sp. NBC_00086]
MSGIKGYLGMDVGGTKVAIRVEGDGAEPYETTFRWRTDDGVRADMKKLAACLEDLPGHWPGPIIAAGIAMPATLDGDGRVTAWPNRPGWRGLDLRSELRRMLPGTTVACADDGDVAALAEARAAGIEDVVYLGIGTGVGGGVVLGGSLCPGAERGSCEIGHLIVDRSGTRCDCGRQGCVQAFASGRAILRRAARLRGEEYVSYEELREAWQAAVPWAVLAVDEACAALAAAAVGTNELFRPSAVIIGGGFADGLPGFVPTVERHTRRLARAGHPAPRIRPALLGGLSSLHGSILLARGVTAGASPADAQQALV